MRKYTRITFVKLAIYPKHKYSHDVYRRLIKHERFLLSTLLGLPSNVPSDCVYDSRCPQFVKSSQLVNSEGNARHCFAPRQHKGIVWYV